MFEHRTQPLVTRRAFLKRLARSAVVASVILVAALFMGMMGYRSLEKMSWVDAFVNAAMILSGMGPVSTLQTDTGKVFAGCYALFSGLAFITAMGVVFAPVFHRFLHNFHLEEDWDRKGKKSE